MRILALIPARGGSKGVPRKNIKPLAGKPLIQYTIEAALASNMLNTIVVSSDDEEILEFSKKFSGIHLHKRDTNIAQDTSLITETIDELLKPFQETKDKKVFLNVESVSIMGKAGILTGEKGDIMIPTSHIFEGTADNYPFENALKRRYYHNKSQFLHYR